MAGFDAGLRLLRYRFEQVELRTDSLPAPCLDTLLAAGLEFAADARAIFVDFAELVVF